MRGAGLAIGLVLAACHARAPRSPAPSEGAVAIVDPGATPRRILAYAPHGGERHAHLSFTIGLPRAPIDAQHVTLALRWTAPASNAQPWRFAVEDATAAPPPDAGSGEQASDDGVHAAFATVRGAVEVTRGRVVLTRTAGAQTQPSVVDLLDLVAVPLPQAEVGVGARWETYQHRTESGMTCTVHDSYTLGALRADDLDVKVSGTVRCTAPGGAGRGDASYAITGAMRVGLDDVLPRDADITEHITMEVENGHPVAYDMRVQLAP